MGKRLAWVAVPARSSGRKRGRIVPGRRIPPLAGPGGGVLGLRSHRREAWPLPIHGVGTGLRPAAAIVGRRTLGQRPVSSRALSVVVAAAFETHRGLERKAPGRERGRQGRKRSPRAASGMTRRLGDHRTRRSGRLAPGDGTPVGLGGETASGSVGSRADAPRRHRFMPCLAHVRFPRPRRDGARRPGTGAGDGRPLHPTRRVRAASLAAPRPSRSLHPAHGTRGTSWLRRSTSVSTGPSSGTIAWM